MHKYKLLYKLEKNPKGTTKDKLPAGYGACDAVLFCSMIYPEDGSFSVHFLGVDGRDSGPLKEGSLKDIEWFKVWSLLSKRLADSETLPEEKKEICRQTFDAIRIKILGFSLNNGKEEGVKI